MSFFQLLRRRQKSDDSLSDPLSPSSPLLAGSAGGTSPHTSAAVSAPPTAFIFSSLPRRGLSLWLGVVLAVLLGDTVTRLLILPRLGSSLPSSCSASSASSSSYSSSSSSSCCRYAPPLPLCPRTSTFHFAPHGAGLCSHLNTLLGALIYSALIQHTAFIDDHQFNYGAWNALFLPWPAHGLHPAALALGEDSLWDSGEAADAFPVWSLEELTEDDYALSTAFTRPSFASVEREAEDASERRCRAPHALAHRHVNFSAEQPPPPHLNLSHLDLASPGLYENPLAARLRASPRPSLAAPAAPAYLLMKRRYLRWLIQPVPTVRERVAAWLQQRGLRVKLSLDEWRQMRGRGSAVGGARVRGRRYVAVHVRRGDKLRSLKVRKDADPSAFFLRAVRDIVNASAALAAVVSDGAFVAPSTVISEACAALGSQAALPQPDVVLVSDDATVYSTLPLLAPCWRWHFPFGGPAHISDRPSTGGHDQSTFDVMELAERESAAMNFLCQLMTLVLADHAVVTYSSNVGRLVATIRGWQDSHVERRVHSLDRGWVEY